MQRLETKRISMLFITISLGMHVCMYVRGGVSHGGRPSKLGQRTQRGSEGADVIHGLAWLFGGGFL